MNDVTIRLATDPDSEKISTLLAEAFQPFESLYSKAAFAATVISPAELCLRMREGPLWVADYQEKTVGTVSVVPRGNDLYLRGMAVSPAAQGLKIGLALLQEAERFAVEHAYRRLFLRTTPYLDKAIRLYEQFGFVRMGLELEDFFGIPSFLMEKKL